MESIYTALRLGLRPDVAVGEHEALPDHVLGLDIFRAALRGEVNDDAVFLQLARDLPLLAVLVGAGDNGLVARELDFARAARVRWVVPSSRRANRRDLAAGAPGQTWRA